jgi:creatinine amidohydrolase
MRSSTIVSAMTWDRIAARIADGAVAIVPIGAGAKEHGFHLPMNTDEIQAAWFSVALAERIKGLIWPVVTYGYYPAFGDYAGSVTLQEQTFEALIEDVVRSVASYASRAVFVLNTGVSTLPPVDRALTRLALRQVKHLKLHEGPRYRAAVKRLAEQAHGSHADEIETSLLLAIAPTDVKMHRAEASPVIARIVPGALSLSDPTSPNYSRSGSFGDPTLASAEKGIVLRDAIVSDLIEQAMDFISVLDQHNSGPASPAQTRRA